MDADVHTTCKAHANWGATTDSTGNNVANRPFGCYQRSDSGAVYYQNVDIPVLKRNIFYFDMCDKKFKTTPENAQTCFTFHSVISDTLRQ